MQDDDNDDTYAAAMRRAQERTRAVIREAMQALDKLIEERESRMAGRGSVWFESAVVQPYREAGSPYGDGRAAAIQWFREQNKNRAGE
jgi:hypothetical protein